MTNIGMIKVKEDNKEYLVCVADGMASYVQNHTKDDNNQKIFRVGDYLLMGTGDGGAIKEMATQLSKMQFSSAKDVADKVLEVSESFGLNEKNYLNFIVGGKDQDGLNVYHINTTGINGMDEKLSDYKKRGYTVGDSAFDGSGSPHVMSYLQGNHEAGKPLTATNLADGLVLAYIFGKKAAKDAGVNDKIQLGIVSDEGVSRLYPSGTTPVNAEESYNYMEEISGIKCEPLSKESSQEEKEKFSQKWTDISDVLSNFYKALDHDLSRLGELRDFYTSVAETYGNDLTPLDVLNRVKDQRLEARANVAKGAEALVEKGLEALLNYQSDFDKRKEKVEDRVHSYLK